MELIQISDNALKVSLTREDMEFYDIEFEMLDYENTETRRAIWNILDEAKRSLGFEAARDSLYIQAYRSKCGGCELFVRRETAKEKEALRHSLFEFDTMELLLVGCEMLKNKHCATASAYAGDNGKFYLEIADDPLFLCEIACRKEPMRGYLWEHATLICHDAVNTLSALR
ncbi:MAG: adaptor protein MecA [Clostridia bacterium]|nr:adaptor protein MecA [Clostridia bacterium]